MVCTYVPTRAGIQTIIYIMLYKMRAVVPFCARFDPLHGISTVKRLLCLIYGRMGHMAESQGDWGLEAP